MEKEFIYLFIYLFIQLMEWQRRSLMWGACYYSYMWMCHVFCVENLFLNCVGDQLKDIGWSNFKTFCFGSFGSFVFGIFFLK